MGKVIATCISDIRGIQKKNVHTVTLIENYGIEGDAHAGDWHRQVSLLSWDKIEAFRAKGAEVADGAFGENLIVEGIDFRTLPIGTKFQCGTVILELTQIGKECHHGCEIFQKMGDCIMPREGVFTKVLQGGVITEGDMFEIIFLPLRAVVLTASDSAYEGTREDVSGPLVGKLLQNAGYQLTEQIVLPDDEQMLKEKLMQLCDAHAADLILTTGGTGFSARDFMPEATKAVIERETPGIPEAMRAYSMQLTGRAMLTRAAAGIRKQTLIINLPGSPKAVEECLSYILPELWHGLEVLLGRTRECAAQRK